MKKIQKVISVLLIALGTCSYAGTVEGGWGGQFVLAAAADAASSEKPAETGGGSDPAAGTSKPRKASERAPEPEKETMPFKTFIPSERIEPDHAVDFPADI